jgi:hypothetical protein
MLCCAVSALAAVAMPMWRTRIAAAFGTAGIVALVAVSAAFAGLAVQHAGHYAGRAHANERTILAEILAQPICSGVQSEAVVSQRNAVGRS